MGLFIDLQPKYVMVIGSEEIWTTESSTGPCKGNQGKESQNDHDQSNCILLQGVWNQVTYQHQ